MPSRTVPESWILTDYLRDYARDKGFSDRQIDDMEEACRCHEFKREYRDWNRVWQRWVRTAIKIGEPIPENKKVAYRTPQELTEEERKQAQMAFENDPKIVAYRQKKPLTCR